MEIKCSVPEIQEKNKTRGFRCAHYWNGSCRSRNPELRSRCKKNEARKKKIKLREEYREKIDEDT